MGQGGIRRPNGTGTSPTRSVRCDDEVWEAARRRAVFENVTISHVVQLILDGYGKGYIDLPKTVVQYGKAVKQ